MTPLWQLALSCGSDVRHIRNFFGYGLVLSLAGTVMDTCVANSLLTACASYDRRLPLTLVITPSTSSMLVRVHCRGGAGGEDGGGSDGEG